MRTSIGLLLLAAVANATFVAELTNVESALLKRIVGTNCSECNTDHGRVDMWLPDSIEEGEVEAGRVYEQVHVRGGAELKELLVDVKLAFSHVHADFEKAVLEEKFRILNRPASFRAAANSTADDFYDDYHQYPDYEALMRSLASQYPASFEVIGLTYQQQPIQALRLGTSSNPLNQTVYIQCGIHSREWISPITCLYFTQKLLEMQAAGDAEITAILAATELWVVPVVNRDGYDFTWSTNRMWRKNMQPNAGSTAVGTDLNRNFNSGYGVCGASTNPASDTYRGAFVWSGPEAAVVRDWFLVSQNQNRRVLGALDVHSYGPEVLRPMGWTPDLLPNEQQEVERARRMILAIAETHGVIFASKRSYDNGCLGGSAKDWFWQVTTTNSGFTLELRGTPGGFILPPQQIVPSGQEIYNAVVVYLKALLNMN